LKILVTGGAGFIGSHLCDRLLELGHEVWCYDNLESGTQGNLAKASANAKFHYIQGDVRDGLPDIVVDRVYHLACPGSPREYRRDGVGTLRTNFLGTLNALEYCQRTGARLLQASTSEIYGDPDVHPQPEDYVGAVSCVGPRACYDEGKRVAETLCYDFHRQHGTEIRVARLFNTYGPRMHAGDGRVIPNFVTQALTGNPLTIHGAGSQTRSFCFVTDMIEALILLMEVPGDRIGPVNLGNPKEFTIRELADIVLAKTGSVSSISHEQLPEDDPRVRCPDISLARKLLRWEPTVMLKDGLDSTIDWFRAEMRADGFTRPAKSDGKAVVGIIGGGPAGLTAAYEFQKHSEGHHVVVFEESDQVGGIARTETYKGYRFDIGGHRFFTKVKPVEALWREVLPEEFLLRPRLSRIFYRGKYFDYPLKIFNALFNMGIYESARIMLSYLKWKVYPHTEEENFEQWVTNRFGGRLFWHFFKSYTEKVWGMPCTELQADWAAQRIKNLSLRKAVLNALTGQNDTTSLIDKFDYPRLGPGMMWEAFRDKVEAQGGEVRMLSSVTRIFHDDDSVTGFEVTTTGENPEKYRFEADQFISSMPIAALVLAMDPPAPPAIQAAARTLKYRDFLIVTLILEGRDLFPDNWVYIHSPEVEVGRIQNFRSWSEDMVPDANRTSIGMEYFCNIDDELWKRDNKELIKQASRELEWLGLAKASSVVDGTVIRQPKAYPVYDGDYREALDMIRGWLTGFSNLQAVGRNGMHRYNNQDHSMLTAMLAVKNVLGASNDLWSVNVEKEYHEDIEAAPDLTRSRAV
jgi:protoporphyrinogen oxidase/nucleoside-diphosphate-sugar epimerase